jgi:hypothetical protein
MVRVVDFDVHHERALARGAHVLNAPTDYPYGERQYSIEDLAGRIWTFSQSVADVAPEDWGGVFARPRLTQPAGRSARTSPLVEPSRSRVITHGDVGVRTASARGAARAAGGRRAPRS